VPRHHPLLASAALAASMTLAARPAGAAIDLSLDPVAGVVEVGDAVEIRLVAASDTGGLAFSAAIDAILAWDPGFLTLVGTSQAGAVPLLSAGFPAFQPLNEASPPADGDALFTALAPLGDPIDVTPGGVLVTTFLFEAIAETPATAIELPATLGGYATTVFDGIVPNLDVTGLLAGTSITVIPSPGAAILLGIFLRSFGGPTRRRHCRGATTPKFHRTPLPVGTAGR